jgi:hypothetical protein
MAGNTTITVSCLERDGSKLKVRGTLGSDLVSKSGWTYDLFYKIGAGGTFVQLDTSGSDITLSSWTYNFDVGTLDAVYLRYRSISLVPTTYTGTSIEINAVAYNKTKNARVSKVKKGVATQNTTRREIPNI